MRGIIGILSLVILGFLSCNTSPQGASNRVLFDLEIIKDKADRLMNIPIETITAHKAVNSEGGIHDYYSEGRYWWPDTLNPEGSYIRRDGVSNPNQFIHHKASFKQFSESVSTLTSTYDITKDERYVQKTVDYLKAWFIDENTKMNPNLLYAQAIKGIASGRGIGIIDGIGLRDVVNSALYLKDNDLIDVEILQGVKSWFVQFNTWLTTHPYGDDEKNNNNNHSTWWGVQVLAYSLMSEDQTQKDIAIEQFKNQLEIQLAEDGSLPHEMERTKPFHYMNYTTQSWVEYAAFADIAGVNLWSDTTTSGQSLRDMVDYAYQKSTKLDQWPFATDVEPQPKLSPYSYFAIAGIVYEQKSWIDFYQELCNGKSDDTSLYMILKRWNK